MKIKAKSGRIISLASVAGQIGHPDTMDVIPEARKATMKANTYINRFATPEEIAKTVFWLGTDSPEYINGVCIDLNNGSFPR